MKFQKKINMNYKKIKFFKFHNINKIIKMKIWYKFKI